MTAEDHHPLRVEFRLLQLVVNSTGDERRTAMLVHWDGRSMRVAWNEGRVPSELQKNAVALRGTLRSLVRKASAASMPHLFNMGIDDVFPVTEGMSTSHVWKPKQVGYTTSPDHHFRHLAELLALEVVQGEPTTSDDGFTPSRRMLLTRSLRDLGHRLIDEVADRTRIDIDRKIMALRSYVSPLSWRNGVWHHCVPLHVVAPGDVDKSVSRAMGVIDASVPDDEIGVMWVVYPSNPAVASEVLRASEYIAGPRFAGRIVCVPSPSNKGTKPDTSALRKRVLVDVGELRR